MGCGASASDVVEETYGYVISTTRLGRGAYSVVRKATRQNDGLVVAMKIVRKADMTGVHLRHVRNEIQLLRRVTDFRYCIRCLDVVETLDRFLIVLELLEGEEVFERVLKAPSGSLSEAEAKHIIRCVLLGVQHLHSLGIVHRDIKPENVMFVNTSSTSPVKLVDLGLAKEVLLRD